MAKDAEYRKERFGQAEGKLGNDTNEKFGGGKGQWFSMSIGKKLMIGFLLVLIIFGAFGWYVYTTGQKLIITLKP